MASKLQNISALSNEIGKSLSDYENWTAFLKSAAWQYNSRFDNAIIETLENSFGELKSKNSITNAIISAAQNAVEDSKADYLSELKYAKENSFLDGLDELNIDVEFQQTAEVSIAYIVLQRLGINADNIFEREDFPHIMNFNTPETLSVLGNAVSSISEETLRNISETIRAEIKNERTKNFAEKEKTIYNENREKTPTKINERTDSYDRDNLHTSERIPDSELDNGRDGSTDRQIRTDEAKIKNIPNYEKEQVALSIENAYAYDITEDMIMPYSSGSEFTNATKILVDKLNDTTHTQTMLTDLKNLLAETSHDAQSYPYREKAVQDLGKYANGEYNLFPHIDRIEEVKEETPEEQPLSEYLAELHKEDNGSKTVAIIPLGDFYEIYGDDAQKAADVLDITVISKEIDGTRYPMCGFLKHITDEYVNKLLYAGYDVVIADENKIYKRLLSADKVIPEQAQQTEIPQIDNVTETAENLIGTELTIDNRKFVVDSVNTDFNKVSLKDITFQNGTGFPIFRSESIDFVKGIIEEQSKPQITAAHESVFSRFATLHFEKQIRYYVYLSFRGFFDCTFLDISITRKREKSIAHIDYVKVGEICGYCCVKQADIMPP